MLPYWLFFLLPVLPALFSAPSMRFRRDGTRSTKLEPQWLFVLVFLTIIIGFRYRVGGDWANYFNYLYISVGMSLSDALSREDPAFWLINVISNRLGWGIAGVNLIGGLIFSTGLVVFCRSLPRPWLALAVAIPYMVIVVGMGYTRQAIALGLVSIGIVALGRKKNLTFLFWICLAATFHRSAVLLVPLVALTLTRNKYLIGLIVIVAFAMAYQLLLSDSIDHLLTVYTDANLLSSGALVRLLMNAVPAVLYLAFSRKFSLSHAEYRFWRLVSFIAIAMLVAYFVTPLSTALDRMALYFIPLQLFVFSHLPDAIGKYGGRNEPIVLAVLTYYACVLFVWLNYADHAYLWLPYQIDVWSLLNNPTP